MAKPEFNIVEFLSRWYIPQTTYADETRRIDDNTVEVDYIVKDSHCDPDRRPILLGEVATEGNVTTNTFVVDGTQPLHTEGHLRNMPIFQAHLADGALIATATQDKPTLWLAGFRTFAHQEPGVPGDRVMATTTLLKEEGGARLVRGKVDCENRTHTRGFDLRLEEGPELPADGFYLPQHTWFEIGAQAVGGAIAVLRPEMLLEDCDPVFDSIGPSTLERMIIRPPDRITSRVTLNRITTQGAVYANVVMRRQGDPLSTLGNLGIGFLPHDLIKARVDELQHTT